VLYFVGHQRGLVLNVTNGLAIASLYGDETDAWRGRWVTLYPTTCQFGNRMVDCIRVRAFPPTDGFGHPMLTSMVKPRPPEAASPQPFGQQQPPPFGPPLPHPGPNGSAPPQFLPPQPPPPAGQQLTFDQQPPQQPNAGHSPVQF
jgi:hypothetical protein